MLNRNSELERNLLLQSKKIFNSKLIIMKSTKILIIDDEEFIRESVSKTLTGAGYTTFTASDLHEATLSIQRERPDLIICDVMLPHLGGFEFVDRLKNDPDKGGIPVIMMTGMDREILHMTVSPADVIITKPFTSQQILEEVRKQLVQPA